MALAWLIGREGVTAPIASATSVAQVESFARAAALGLSAGASGAAGRRQRLRQSPLPGGERGEGYT
ncbi:hypothetical protein LNP05_10090 [Klebsiella pneumoniae subsp. pneumoniae]|nr:hypothetical protein [Klebsiella pneumoniae subsp. pneumoniae]